MTSNLQRRSGRDVANYDPNKGLLTIAAAREGERRAKRVKNVEELRKAVEIKITAQAEYICWRDSIVVPSRRNGAPGRGKKEKRVNLSGPVLPDGDPGKQIAQRWRNDTCSKNGEITVIDKKKLKDAIERAHQRAIAICENERDIIKQIHEELHQERMSERMERERELADRITELPERRYGVIYADPEWQFETYSERGKAATSAENHYPTSPLDVIKARDVPSIAYKDSVLFLWATVPMMPQALEVMAAWGFNYVSSVAWVKDRTGTGYWFLNKHELLLVGTRGQVPAPPQGDQWPSVIEAPRGAHSEKPGIFYELIEAYYPNLPKIELNARNARPGWDSWGLEAPMLDAAQ